MNHRDGRRDVDVHSGSRAGRSAAAPPMGLEAAALYAAALTAALVMAPRTPVYWDTFGYVLQALTGQVGGLGLGRPVFVLASHGLASAWLAAGGSPWTIEPLLRGFWMAVSCAAAPLTWRLALACGLKRRAALWAGLAVACSPAMAQVGGTLLTDGPAVTFLLLGCLWGVGAVRQDASRAAASVWLALGAGAALGLAAGVREQSILNLAVFALLIPLAPRAARWRIAFAMTLACGVMVVAPVAWAAATESGYVGTVRAWLVFVAQERARKPYRWQDAAVFAAWVLALGPVVAVAAARVWTRAAFGLWRVRSALFAIAVPALVQLLWLSAYQDIAYSPRYLLSALPGALAIPGALGLDAWIGGSRRRIAAVAAAFVLPILVAAPILQWRGAPLEATIRDWPSRLMSAPDGSAIVSGQPCAAVPLVQALAVRAGDRSPDAPDWQPICPGWGWPADLTARLDRVVRDGRPVVIDLRPASWVGAEQQAARSQAERYVRGHAPLEQRGVLIVWR